MSSRRAALRHLDDLTTRVRAGDDAAARELIVIGTPEAKGALFASLRGLLFFEANQLAVNSHDAEDAAVRAFDAAWDVAAVRQVRIDTSVIGYFRVAARRLGSTARTSAYAVSRGVPTDPEAVTHLANDAAESLGDLSDTFASDHETQVVAAAVAAGLAELPDRSRQVLDVRLKSVSLRQAAVTLDMTPKAAQVSTARATAKLRSFVLQRLVPNQERPAACRAVADSLGRLLTDLLDVDDATAALAHVDECVACAALYADIAAAKRRHFAQKLMRGVFPLPLLRGLARRTRWATESASRATATAGAAAAIATAFTMVAAPSLRPWTHTPTLEAPAGLTVQTELVGTSQAPYAVPPALLLTPWLGATPPGATPTSGFGLGLAGYTDPSGRYDPLKDAPVYVATPAVPGLARGSNAPLLEISFDPFAQASWLRPPGSEPVVHADASQPLEPKVEVKGT